MWNLVFCWNSTDWNKHPAKSGLKAPYLKIIHLQSLIPTKVKTRKGCFFVQFPNSFRISVQKTTETKCITVAFRKKGCNKSLQPVKGCSLSSFLQISKGYFWSYFWNLAERKRLQTNWLRHGPQCNKHQKEEKKLRQKHLEKMPTNENSYPKFQYKVIYWRKNIFSVRTKSSSVFLVWFSLTLIKLMLTCK